MSESEVTRTQRLLILSGIVDLVLGGSKLAVGLLANSHALIADGIHSLSDLATDIMVWFFNLVGTQAPDEDHPYGHARFETLGALILGAALIILAALLVYDSIFRLMNIEDVQTPTWPALIAASLSIFSKEWLYRITHKLGLETGSNLLIANAWHHRSDALSSVIVLVGVGGAILGVTWLEMVATVGVALMIGQIGWSLSRQSIDELVDTALSKEDVEEIKLSVVGAEGVRGVHNIRTRKMGADVLLDIHLQVDPSISVSEGHHIGEWVTRGLLDRFSFLADIIVHIDAEDDALLEERNIPQSMPPLRKDVRQILIRAWEGVIDADDIVKLTLHYLNNRINVELYLQGGKYESGSNLLRQQLTEKTQDVPWVNQLKVWYS